MTVGQSLEKKLYALLDEAVSSEPRPMFDVLSQVTDSCAVDREEVVAALWDLVSDGRLVYSADATVKHH